MRPHGKPWKQASETRVDTRPSITQTGFSAEGNPPTKIDMVFRFWGPSGKAAGDGGPVQHPGVLALIEDAVTARRGVFVSAKEQLYVSGLKEPADALVVSRQVQLGLEGFRSRHAAGPVAVSIAIDASGAANGNQGIEPPHDLVTLLKLAKPAQVLLTHDLCQQVEPIKGLPLKSFPGRFGVYEYLWTAEEKLDLLQSEPQLTLAAMPVAAPTVSEKSVAAPSAKPPAPAAEREPAPAEMVAEKPPAFQSPKVLGIAGVGVVALAAAVFGVMHLSHGTPSTGSGAGTESAPATAPVQSTPAPPTAPIPPAKTVEKPHVLAVQQKPAAAKTAPQETPQVEQKPVTAPAPTPEAPAANCILGANAARYVGLAEQARGRGDYANAIRIFREVLDCDPNNAAAREGLDKAQRGAQSH